MNEKLSYIQMTKKEAYLEYAPTWLKSLNEIGLFSATIENAKAVVDMLFEKKAKVLRLEKHNKTIGYLGFYTKHEYGSISCYLEFIYILNDYRRNGFATQAINYMQNYCKENNVKFIRLWVSTLNKKSINLFESLGFLPKTIEFGKSLSD